MKIDRESREDHQVKLTVEMDNEVMESAKRRAARRLSGRVKIPGFRPGKAPYSVIVNQVGEEAIIDEAMDLLINEVYPKVIEEAKISPYGPGSLEKVISLDPPSFEFIVPLSPEVQLGNYREIRRIYQPTEISNKDIDEVLDNLRTRQAEMILVDRPSIPGDIVTIQMKAIRKSDAESQEEILLPERTMTVLIKSEKGSSLETEPELNSEKEWPFEGFSSNLVGMIVDQEKSFLHSFPDDDENDALKGMDAQFNIIVEKIEERKLPELGDEFAKSFGDYPDFNSLRIDIFNSLTKQSIDGYNEAYDDEILKEAIENAEFSYPPQALEDEIDRVIRNFESNLKRQNIDLDLYMKTRDIDMNGLREEARPIAEENLRKALFLIELARVEGIEVQKDEIKHETIHTLDILSRSLPRKQVRKLSEQSVINNLTINITTDLITRHAMQRFRDICSGKFDETENQEISETTNTVNDDLIGDEQKTEEFNGEGVRIVEE